MVLVPTQQVILEVVAMLGGLGLGTICTRVGLAWRWMAPVILVVFFAVWFTLGTAEYAWFGGFLAGVWLGVAWGLASKAGAIARDSIE